MDYSKIFAYEIPDNKLLFEEKVFLIRKSIPGPIRRIFGLILFIPLFLISAVLFYPVGWFLSWIFTGNDKSFADKTPCNSYGGSISTDDMKIKWLKLKEHPWPNLGLDTIYYKHKTDNFRGFEALFFHDSSSIKFYRMIKDGKIKHYRKKWE